MATQSNQAPARADQGGTRCGVVVGWIHHPVGTGIDLTLQSAVSAEALARDEVTAHHFLMTRNQALLVANYLLESTGQTLPRRRRPGLLRRLFTRG